MSATILERLAAVLIDRFGLPADELHPGVTFAELDLDSLALVELAMVVEREFGIPIADDELSPDSTMTTAVELIGMRFGDCTGDEPSPRA
jgi:acyl carrier protein